MKFRFCGEGDCPDWVLAEIISTLSNISANKLESLTSMVANKIIGHSLEEDSIKSITADVADDGKSVVACIDYILVNAARYNTDQAVLLEELQQLGLPKPHASAICQVLADVGSAIREKLVQKSFKINEVNSVEITIPKDCQNTVLLELKIFQELVGGLPRDVSHIVNLDSGNLITLLKEMRQAKAVIQKYNSNADHTVHC